MRFDHLAGLVGKARRDLSMLEVGRDITGTPEGALDTVPSFLAANAGAVVNRLRRRHHGRAVSDVEVGLDVERRVHAKERIETTIDRAAGQWLFEIEVDTFRALPLRSAFSMEDSSP